MAQKVSQATIDKIKAMGMTAALKKAGTASPEMREGLKRMYGAKRVAASTGAAPKSTSTGGYPKPAAKKGTPMRPVSTGSSPTTASKPKGSTTSNPFTAAHNALSPYGNKSQTYVSGLPKTGYGQSSKPGKPSASEQFTSVVGGILKGKGVPNRMTAAQVAKINADRIKAVAAAKAAKKK